MSRDPGILATDVRLLRQDQIDDSFAGALGMQRLAEVTHLPTGIASGQMETVTVPAGSTLAPRMSASEETLVHVVTGHVRVTWGSALDKETPAGPGDTLLVPPGTPFRLANAKQTTALQLILVRGAG